MGAICSLPLWDHKTTLNTDPCSIYYPKIAQEVGSKPVVQGIYCLNKPTSKAFSDKQTSFKTKFSFWYAKFRYWASQNNKPNIFPINIESYTSFQNFYQNLSMNLFWLFFDKTESWLKWFLITPKWLIRCK